jgi:signal transduction histidine kinase
MHRLIEELLDVSRMETGQLSIQRWPLDLAALSRRVVAEFQPTLADHSLIYQAPATRLPILGDDMRLTQVLDNLINNAIKYSPHGGEITVRAWQDGDQTCLSVTDQGIGIPEAELPNLFQRFYRATNANLQNFHGIGVGLYVVREIIALHGGTIAVASSEGQGSTFTICLPAAREQPVAE